MNEETLRDEFAIAVMLKFLSEDSLPFGEARCMDGMRKLTKFAYEIADAMLTEKAKREAEDA